MNGDTSLQDEPATEKTINDLYNSIGWAPFDRLTDTWLKDHPDSDIADHRETFRLTVLNNALFHPVKELRENYQYQLHRAGLWEDIVARIKEWNIETVS